jgi:hypothetical protein
MAACHLLRKDELVAMDMLFAELTHETPQEALSFLTSCTRGGAGKRRKRSRKMRGGNGEVAKARLRKAVKYIVGAAIVYAYVQHFFDNQQMFIEGFTSIWEGRCVPNPVPALLGQEGYVDTARRLFSSASAQIVSYFTPQIQNPVCLAYQEIYSNLTDLWRHPLVVDYYKSIGATGLTVSVLGRFTDFIVDLYFSLFQTKQRSISKSGTSLKTRKRSLSPTSPRSGSLSTRKRQAM